MRIIIRDPGKVIFYVVGKKEKKKRKMGLMIFLRQCIVMLQPYTLRAPKMKVYNVRQAEFYEHL